MAPEETAAKARAFVSTPSTVIKVANTPTAIYAKKHRPGRFDELNISVNLIRLAIGLPYFMSTKSGVQLLLR